MTPSTNTRSEQNNRWAIFSYLEGMAPVIIVWLALVGWLAALLNSRSNWSEESDEATIREWLDETRTFRKTLPELVREYVRIQEEEPSGSAKSQRLQEKQCEIEEHMRALAEPTRVYLNQLPGFPVIYSIEVEYYASKEPDSQQDVISWTSPIPRPRPQNQSRVHRLDYHPMGAHDQRAAIRCEYQLHAFNKLQRSESERQQTSLVAAAVLVAATLLAVLFVVRFLRRERARELQHLATQAEAEHRERELLEVRVQQQEAEHLRDELDRKLLEQQLEAAKHEQRANEAEREALEMKSQLYASIGIMAGSYAHNIKNLLVRPNDLLIRCINDNKLSSEQTGMLQEVHSTLGTVTERLQQILRTVRRDPSKTEMVQVNLNQFAMDTVNTWSRMALEKWKLKISAQVASAPLWIHGDISHLQQALENLVFNARDATFEMRNHLVETARNDRTLEPQSRRQHLIDAYAWKGDVTITTYQEDRWAILEIKDNGIGMNEEVKQNCLRTHFSTKRDNAIYEGFSAGMGLGLSFVVVVLEHHNASISIETEPYHGALFRIRFPISTDNMLPHPDPVQSQSDNAGESSKRQLIGENPAS